MIVAFAIGCVFYRNRVNDPIYEGRHLSTWVTAARFDCWLRGGPTWNSGEEARCYLPSIRVRFSGVAQDAIHHDGTNALPLLVQMLGSKQTPLKRWIWEEVEAHPFLQRNIRLTPPIEVLKRKIGATGAFLELGESASWAIPQIKPLLKDPECAQAAIIALLATKPQRTEDIASFTNVLCIGSVPASLLPPGLIKLQGLWALASFGPRASGAIPTLLSCLTSTNRLIQASAAYALAKIGFPADQMVPLIVRHLPTSSSAPLNVTGPQSFMEAQSVALNILALKEYGKEARSALPELMNLKTSPYPKIPLYASEAIAAITGTNAVNQ